MTEHSGPIRPSLPWHLLLLVLFMLAIIFISLRVQENYPFSHFPMYGNPNGKPVDYYFLTDGVGNPLPVRKLMGDTAPRIKKRINTAEEKYIRDTGHKGTKAEIPEAERTRIREVVLDGFLAQSKLRGTVLPDTVEMWRALIHQREDGYAETFTREFSRKTGAPAPAATEAAQPASQP